MSPLYPEYTRVPFFVKSYVAFCTIFLLQFAPCVVGFTAMGGGYQNLANEIVAELHKMVTTCPKGLTPHDKMRHQKDVKLPAAKIALQFIQGAPIMDEPPLRGNESAEDVRSRLKMKKDLLAAGAAIRSKSAKGGTQGEEEPGDAPA